MCDINLCNIEPNIRLVFVCNTAYGNRDIARIASVVLAEVIIGLFFYVINVKDGKGIFKKNIVFCYKI